MKFEDWINIGLGVGVIVSLAGIFYIGKKEFGHISQDEAELSKQVIDTANNTGKLFIDNEETKQVSDIVTEFAKMGFDYLKEPKKIGGDWI